MANQESFDESISTDPQHQVWWAQLREKITPNNVGAIATTTALVSGAYMLERCGVALSHPVPHESIQPPVFDGETFKFVASGIVTALSTSIAAGARNRYRHPNSSE